MSTLLLQNEYFKLFVKENDVIITTSKPGYPLKSFDEITRQHPQLRLDSFSALRKAITQLGEEHVIGTWLPLVEVTVARDRLSVEIILNTSAEEIEKNKEGLLAEVNRVLDQRKIVHGRKNLQDIEIKPKAAIIAAEGRAPVKGADAVITYIERPERKPVIREDGTANYYEMNFVFPVEEGQWLGVKHLAQDGEDGMDVFGDAIPALKGEDFPLEYDRQSVYEQEEEDKIVLYAQHGGALEYVDGLISVGKLLVIPGDVGPETGSITFDGAVRVQGTVHTGYSVTATEDIAIEGNEGITNAKLIHTSGGDIYIKGGVFGSGKTTIEAANNIYLKHANNCKLHAKEVHVGVYLFGTDVTAEHVYVDKYKGKIIGGIVDALFTIECAISGNLHERETTLRTHGIDRKALYRDVQEMASELKERQKISEELEGHLKKLGNGHSLTKEQQIVHEKIDGELKRNDEKASKLDKEIQFTLKRIKTAQEAKIEVTKEAFPGTSIQIGKYSTVLYKGASGVFKVEDGVLNV